MTYKVLLYEDNSKLRESLSMLLSEETGFSIAGSYAHCDNVATHLAETGAELIVMDIDMPGIGGIEGVKAAKTFNPEVMIVMHTVFDDDDRIFDSICAGADGYLLKNADPLQLIEALRKMMNGDVAMSPFVAKKVFEFFRKQNAPVKDGYNLSARELQILELLVKGNSYKMIADKASISSDTVKKHLQNIYRKLHVSCSTEAVAKALRQKIIL